MKDSFSVRQLTVRNFKGISQATIEFDNSLTLLTGDNGVGKTSVLQALLAGLCAIWQTDSEYEKSVFSLPDDLVKRNAKHARLTIAISDPLHRVESFAFLIPVNHDSFSRFEREPVREFIHSAHFDHRLPLLVYYAQDRGSSRILSFFDSPLALVTGKSNQETSLATTASSLPEFTSWFYEKEAMEGQEIRARSDATYQDSELKIVRSLLKHFDYFSAIWSRRNSFLITKNDIYLAFESLSGGERVFLLLVLDLARRLMVSQPNRKLSELRGIVCIDEIELHLHPKWQRQILKTLTDAFPACQFIVTTHSPQVASSVASEQVRTLSIDSDGNVEVGKPLATRGRDSNYLLQDVFKSTDSDPDVISLVEAFDNLVANKQFDEAERIVETLDRMVEGGSSRIANIRAKLRRVRKQEE